MPIEVVKNISDTLNNKVNTPDLGLEIHACELPEIRKRPTSDETNIYIRFETDTFTDDDHLILDSCIRLHEANEHATNVYHERRADFVKSMSFTLNQRLKVQADLGQITESERDVLVQSMIDYFMYMSMHFYTWQSLGAIYKDTISNIILADTNDSQGLFYTFLNVVVVPSQSINVGEYLRLNLF